MAKWFEDTGDKGDIVLSTRIRLARNLKGIPYPNKMSADDAKGVIELVEKALDEMNYSFIKYDMSALSKNERERLVEERYISPKLAASKLPACAYISEDASISIMVNEEDHIRLQCIMAGYAREEAYKHISMVDSYLCERLDYAMHEKYGYLASCLTNVGTGMRISYMLHLPAICAFKVSDSVFSAISKLGAAVRGMYGEGTKSDGSLYQISNQFTLGRSEDEIIEAVGEVVVSVIEKEQKLRQELKNQQGLILEDKIMRSYAALTSARIMQSKEMMNLLSNVRLGLSLGIIDDIDIKLVNSLMINASRAHMSKPDLSDSDFERDVERASYLRETLKKERR